MQAARVHQMRGVDELCILDIRATIEGRGPDCDLIRDLTDECFMPITVGGGVRSVDDIHDLLHAGADKVAICTAALENPEIINEAAHRFGSQAVVVSIDVKDGIAWSRSATRPSSQDYVDWAKEVCERGAGEIILCSIARDGTLSGYDIDMLWWVCRGVNVPCVASGGCASYENMAAAIRAGAHAVAAGALFQFTDATPRGAAEYLAKAGIPARVAA